MEGWDTLEARKRGEEKKKHHVFSSLLFSSLSSHHLTFPPLINTNQVPESSESCSDEMRARALICVSVRLWLLFHLWECSYYISSTFILVSHSCGSHDQAPRFSYSYFKWPTQKINIFSHHRKKSILVFICNFLLHTDASIVHLLFKVVEQRCYDLAGTPPCCRVLRLSCITRESAPFI